MAPEFPDAQALQCLAGTSPARFIAFTYAASAINFSGTLCICGPISVVTVARGRRPTTPRYARKERATPALCARWGNAG